MNTPRYRTPLMMAALLSMQLMSPEALASTIDRSHETMRAEVGRLVTAQDRARLLLGVDEFAEVWRTTPGENDGMPIDVMADAIASLSASVGATMSPFPSEPILAYLLRIAETDPAHPLVTNRAVLQAACHGIDQVAPDWSGLDAYAASRAVLDAGPTVGQACVFVAADESVRDGTVSHVWGSTCVNLTFVDDDGSTRTASSVVVVRQVTPGARYVCVLK
jgi:hypothetical protein